MTIKFPDWLRNVLPGIVVALLVYYLPALPIRANTALLFGFAVFLLMQYFRPEFIPLRAGFFQIVAAVVLLGSSWQAGLTLDPVKPTVWYQSSLGPIPIVNWSVVLMLLVSAYFNFRHHRLIRRDENEFKLADSKIAADVSATDQVTNLLDTVGRQISAQLVSLSDPHNIDGVSSELILGDGKREIKVQLETRLLYNDNAIKEFTKNPDAIERASQTTDNPISYEFAIKLVDTSFHLAITILEEVSKTSGTIDVRTELTLSDLYLKAHRPEDSERANNRVLEVEPTNSYAISRKAYFSYAGGDNDEAERLSIEIINSKKERGQQVALDYKNLAALLLNTGRPTEANPYIQKAYDAVENGDTTTTAASIKLVEAAAVHNHGSLTNDASLYLKSQRLYFRSHSMFENLSNDSVMQSRSKCEIARFYLEQYELDTSGATPAVDSDQRLPDAINHGALKLAEDYLLESIDLAKTFKAFNYPHVKDAFELLLQIYDRQYRMPEFLDLVKTHIDDFKSMDGATELVRERGVTIFADLYINANRFDLAEPLYLEAIELLESSPIPNKRYFCTALANLGAYYRDYKKDFNAAEKYIQLALAQRQIHQGSLHYDTAQTRKNLAYVLRMKGKQHYEEARILYIEALRILILELGYENEKVAKWVRDFAMLNYDEGAYWLARIKFKYAYDLYMRLGSIQMFQLPSTLFPYVPGCPKFPPVPFGPIHIDLAYCIKKVNAAEEQTGKGIRLFQLCTKYSNHEISKMMEVPMWMVEGPLPVLEEATT